MPSTDTSRRLRPTSLSQDIASLRGLRTISQYPSSHPELTLQAIQTAYDEMITAQDEESEKMVHAKSAADKARLAEWQFHQKILAMKDLVRGLYGSDSDEAQAIGYKKKSERKRPRRAVA